jgi:serine/threonine-protein kinase
MAAAVGLTRPEPLPLVGAIDAGATPETASELTRMGLPIAGPSDSPTKLPTLPVEDSPKRRWPWMLLAVLLVVGGAVGGAYAWVVNQPESTGLPELAGLSTTEAQAELADIVRDINPNIQFVDVREPGTVEGDVVRTDPEAGTSIEEGDEILIYVSLGEPLVPLPDLTGRTPAEAGVDLGLLELVLGETTLVNDEEVAAGLVVAPDVAEDVAEVEPGTVIDVFVSDGPAPRAVPDVAADGSPETASAELTAQRFEVDQTLEYSDDVPEGDVIGYLPASGSIEPAGTTVTIIVSQGPEPQPIPNVIALSVEEATSELEALGFVVTNVVGSPSLPVLATDPPAGGMHLPGTEVAIATELN